MHGRGPSGSFDEDDGRTAAAAAAAEEGSGEEDEPRGDRLDGLNN